jgi:hypothetical protein
MVSLSESVMTLLNTKTRPDARAGNEYLRECSVDPGSGSRGEKRELHPVEVEAGLS